MKTTNKDNFAEKAREFSKDPGSAKNGGSLGETADLSKLVPEFANAVKNGKAGDIVGPIKTQFGYHIIYIQSKDPKNKNVAKISHILITPTISEASKQKVIKKIQDLKAEIEDYFYHAHQELNKLFYTEKEMQTFRLATPDLVDKETPESSFAIFQKMLQNDKIDIFFMGDFNEIEVCEHMKTFGLQPRQLSLQLHYHQEFSNILKESLERKDAHQSIVELGYHFSTQYGDKTHIPLIVLNGLLGGFAHSKLFVNVREKEGLAYTISSSFDIFSGMMRIYAGIDRKNRTKTVSLIYRQIADLKKGHFTDEALNQTKKMLRNAMLLSLDRQNTLIEQAYMASVLQKTFMPIAVWLNALEAVSREDIIVAATQLRLQAIYFMEGK